MKESCIDVVSRSAMTADATPVVLSSTERFRFRFMPMLVDNQNNPEQSVRGKLLLERKSKNEKYFPTDSVAPCEKVTRGSAKNGDWVEIEPRDLEEADTVRAFSPKCVVVIGKISTLNAKQQKAFELYRSSFNNLTIITFDELHQKICDLMSVFKEDSPRPVDSLMDEFSIIDEDYPI